MLTFKMWDKVSPIGGVSAEEILTETKMFQTDSVFCTYLNDIVVNIESVRVIRQSLMMSSDKYTDEEVAQRYTDNANAENLQLPENIKKLKEAEDKINVLEAGLANAEYAMMMGGLM